MEVEATYNGFDEETEVRNRKKSDSGSDNNWTFTEYQYDKNGNVTVRLEDGEETPAGTEVTKPRRHLFTYDQADWMEFQRKLRARQRLQRRPEGHQHLLPDRVGKAPRHLQDRRHLHGRGCRLEAAREDDVGLLRQRQAQDARDPQLPQPHCQPGR